MAEIDRETLDLWLARYQDQHRSYDSGWNGVERPPAPAYFEVSFGLPLEGEVDPISREEPLEIDAFGVKVKLVGRIDRIDVGEASGRPIFTIVDYKSGRPRSPAKDQPLDGTSLQLELYAIAAQDMLLAPQGALPWEAGYWHLREKKGYRAWFELHAGGRGKVFVDWESRRREALQKLAELVSGIRAAQFPVHSLDQHCTGLCPFHTVCRVNQVRALEKPRP
jgi:RecB family exonuclease